MKVTQTGSNSVQGTDVASTKAATKAQQAKKADKAGNAAPASGSSAESAKADISARGKEFARAQEVATSAPDTREAKIAELKKRIADGKYNVDAKAVADKMVDEHLMSGLG